MSCIAPRWTYHIDLSIGDSMRQLRSAKKGQVITCHFRWSPETVDYLRDEGFKTFLMTRDLRDIAWSAIHYITSKDPTHRLHKYFQTLSSDEERLTAIIGGIDGAVIRDGKDAAPISALPKHFLGWLGEPDCMVVRFEDLIGDAGGGNDERQFETVTSIMRHVGLDSSEEEVTEVATKVFYTKARTFRKGQIGDWKNHFTEEHKRLFKETAGEALIKMGYEKGTDW